MLSRAFADSSCSDTHLSVLLSSQISTSSRLNSNAPFSETFSLIACAELVNLLFVSLASYAYHLPRSIKNWFLLSCKIQILWLIQSLQHRARVFDFIVFLVNKGKKREQRRKGKRKKRTNTSHFRKVDNLVWKKHSSTWFFLKRQLEANRVKPTQVPVTFLSKCSAPETALGTGVDDTVSGSQSPVKFF